MPNARPVNPPTLYPGAPYSYAMVAPAGSVVYTAGACPIDAEGKVAGVGDLERQARVALDNLERTLAEAGSGFERVVKTTVYVVARDRSELIRVWAVVQDRFGAGRPPSTLLGVRLLGYADQLVEIEAIALV